MILMHILTHNFSRDEVNKLLKQASDDEAVGISILVTVLIVSPIIIMLVQNAVATIQVSLSIEVFLSKR